MSRIARNGIDCHLPSLNMIPTKTSAAKFSNFLGSARSNIAANNDALQKVWEYLMEMQISVLSLNFKVAL